MRMYVYTNLFGQQCQTAALLFFPLTHPCQCLPLFFFFFRMWESCHTFCSVLIYGTGHLTTAPRSSNISGFWEPGVCFLSVCVGHSFTLHSVLLRVNKNKWKGMETGGILWGRPRLAGAEGRYADHLIMLSSSDGRPKTTKVCCKNKIVGRLVSDIACAVSHEDKKYGFIQL